MNENRFNFKYGDITLTDDFCKIEKKRRFSFVDFLCGFIHLQKWALLIMFLLCSLIHILFGSVLHSIVWMFMLTGVSMLITKGFYNSTLIPVKDIRKVTTDTANIVITFTNKKGWSSRCVILLSKCDKEVRNELMKHFSDIEPVDTYTGKEMNTIKIISSLGIFSIVCMYLTMYLLEFQTSYYYFFIPFVILFVFGTSLMINHLKH